MSDITPMTSAKDNMALTNQGKELTTTIDSLPVEMIDKILEAIVGVDTFTLPDRDFFKSLRAIHLFSCASTRYNAIFNDRKKSLMIHMIDYYWPTPKGMWQMTVRLAHWEETLDNYLEDWPRYQGYFDTVLKADATELITNAKIRKLFASYVRRGSPSKLTNLFDFKTCSLLEIIPDYQSVAAAKLCAFFMMCNIAVINEVEGGPDGTNDNCPVGLSLEAKINSDFKEIFGDDGTESVRATCTWRRYSWTSKCKLHFKYELLRQEDKDTYNQIMREDLVTAEGYELPFLE